MNTRIISVLAYFLIVLQCTAQNISYDALKISSEIKKNASVIKRYENILFEVFDVNRSSYKVHQVYTVLSEKGNAALVFAEHSDKFTTIEEVEIKVYDAVGRQLSKHRKKDLTTVSIGDGLIDDSKTSYFEVPTSSYPITVEYNYELRNKGTLFYPPYEVLKPGEAVEQSTFTTKVPTELGLRFKEKNIALKPTITEDGKYTIYTWKVANLPPYEYEDGAKNYEPVIFIAANKFKYDDYEGDLSTWRGFGEWYSKLNTGLDVLSPSEQEIIRELVKDAKTDRERIAGIYKYLQENFRYVSIQLGIGGLKPFSAQFTATKKYGDCKALSNYMLAALKTIGIKSYTATINRGYNLDPMDLDFPMKKSNHVILCVPNNQDTIWLECTSKTTDFGVLGSDNEDRTALLNTDNGGVLVYTPKSKADNNKLLIRTQIALKEDGSGTSMSSIHGTGEFKYIIDYVIHEKKDDQKNFLVNYLHFKQPDAFSMMQDDATWGKELSLKMDFEKIPEFAAGNKVFLRPRMYQLASKSLPKAENRKMDFYFSYPYTKIDSTIYELPQGYAPEVLPKNQKSVCANAFYTTEYWYDEPNRRLYSVAKITVNDHKVIASQFEQTKAFFDGLLKDHSQRIVIQKN